MTEPPKIGTTISERMFEDSSLWGMRDAQHIATVLVCGPLYEFNPGQEVRFTDKYCRVVEPVAADGHAIVDPFLIEPVESGSKEMFWVFIKPGLVGKFVHRYDIQGFPTAKELEEERLSEEREYDECRGCN